MVTQIFLSVLERDEKKRAFGNVNMDFYDGSSVSGNRPIARSPQSLKDDAGRQSYCPVSVKT